VLLLLQLAFASYYIIIYLIRKTLKSISNEIYISSGAQDFFIRDHKKFSKFLKNKEYLSLDNAYLTKLCLVRNALYSATAAISVFFIITVILYLTIKLI
jgi:hypothetical protein